MQEIYYLDKIKLLVFFAENGEVNIAFRMSLEIYHQAIGVSHRGIQVLI